MFEINGSWALHPSTWVGDSFQRTLPQVRSRTIIFGVFRVGACIYTTGIKPATGMGLIYRALCLDVPSSAASRYRLINPCCTTRATRDKNKFGSGRPPACPFRDVGDSSERCAHWVTYVQAGLSQTDIESVNSQGGAFSSSAADCMSDLIGKISNRAPARRMLPPCHRKPRHS